MRTLAAEVWPLKPEVPASEAASASCYQVVKHIRILPVIETELELREIQRHVFLTDLVEGADNAALKQRPE
jgi:hypothetical protein